MANVLLSWTAPSVTTNVDGIVVLRLDQTSAPACADFIAANTVRDTTANDIASGVTQVDADITNLATVSAVDTGVATGDYWYAAFSYNAAGYSPCDVTDSVLTIA